MRPVDRRPLAEDLDLLAEHLKQVYNLSVSAVHPPAFRPRLPCDISVASLFKTITVILNDKVPSDLPHSPPPYLDYYEIEYVVGHGNVIGNEVKPSPPNTRYACADRLLPLYASPEAQRA